MLRDPRIDEEQAENLEIVQRSSEHLLGLINDVLETVQDRGGQDERSIRSSFDLHRLLYGLEEMFRLRAEYKGLVT